MSASLITAFNQSANPSNEQGTLLVPCKNCLAAIIKTAQEVK
ncbi:TPA: hypothetical protein ACVIMP_003334 [Escherichia coli]